MFEFMFPSVIIMIFILFLGISKDAGGWLYCHPQALSLIAIIIGFFGIWLEVNLLDMNYPEQLKFMFGDNIFNAKFTALLITSLSAGLLISSIWLIIQRAHLNSIKAAKKKLKHQKKIRNSSQEAIEIWQAKNQEFHTPENKKSENEAYKIWSNSCAEIYKLKRKLKKLKNY